MTGAALEDWRYVQNVVIATATCLWTTSASAQVAMTCRLHTSICLGGQQHGLAAHGQHADGQGDRRVLPNGQGFGRQLNERALGRAPGDGSESGRHRRARRQHRQVPRRSAARARRDRALPNFREETNRWIELETAFT